MSFNRTNINVSLRNEDLHRGSLHTNTSFTFLSENQKIFMKDESMIKISANWFNSLQLIGSVVPKRWEKRACDRARSEPIILCKSSSCCSDVPQVLSRPLTCCCCCWHTDFNILTLSEITLMLLISFTHTRLHIFPYWHDIKKHS